MDSSHGNSEKDHTGQPVVFKDLIQQRASNEGIVGLMLETHLNEGYQSLGDDPSKLEYGVSITDACNSWEQTDELIRDAYAKLGG